MELEFIEVNIAWFMAMFLLFSFLDWRKGVMAMLYWILLVGAFRKWWLAGVSQSIYFTPHLLLVGGYCWCFALKGGEIGKALGRVPFVAFLLTSLVLWGFLSMVHPGLPNLRVGLAGVFIHFYLIPLAFTVPYLFKNKSDLFSFFTRYAFFSIPLLILGLVQFYSPIESEINKYIGEIPLKEIAYIGLHPRVTSTFSYPTGFAKYLTALILILTYLLSRKKLSLMGMTVFTTLITLSITNLFMTGSRESAGATLLALILFLFTSIRLGTQSRARLFVRFALVLSVVVLAFRSVDIAKASFSAFKERAEQATDVRARLIDTFTPFKFLDQAGLFGYGIGTTYQGIQRWEIDWGTMTKDFEEEPERILLELGLIGYLLIYLLRLALLFQFWKLFKTLRDIDLRLLALCSLLYQLQFMHFAALVGQFTSSVFYWFFVGFLFLLPRLEKIEEGLVSAKTYPQKWT